MNTTKKTKGTRHNQWVRKEVEPERNIEKYLVDQCKALGILRYKWRSPSNRGVPDDILFLRGNTVIVECKATDKDATPLQDFVIGNIRAQDIPTFVVDSRAKVDIMLAWMVTLELNRIDYRGTASRLYANTSTF